MSASVTNVLPHQPDVLTGLPPVAVIGAGPGGLVTARWLLAKGFDCLLLESCAELGGQWNGANPRSATWPGLVTNTSRVTTAFSDLDHPEGTATYPTREQAQAYLQRYAERFDLLRRIRYGCEVTELDHDPSGQGWQLRWREKGALQQARFQQVVVATGAQSCPATPNLPGLESFSGSLGVHHTAYFRGAAHFSGASVLSVGCSISSLEIATSLAQQGVDVHATYRRQRYVLPKLLAGVPNDHVMFTRSAALAGECLPLEAVAEGLKAQVLRYAGSPEQWGARQPHANILQAGITGCQGFLPLVAEGRIKVHPWIEAIEGDSVVFQDGSRERFDALLLGTGFRFHLPFLSRDLCERINLQDKSLGLYGQTLHPQLSGLAFIGFYGLIGPYWPVLELQARWLAGCWGDVSQLPDGETMQAVINAQAAHPMPAEGVPTQVMALQFARLAGVEPTLSRWPELERALLFGPLSPASFRLEGPDALADAPQRTLAAAACFGHQADTVLRPEEVGLRDALSQPAREVAPLP